MDCERTTERLSAYLDGQLPEPVRAEVRRHLGACPQCASELEGLCRLGGLLDALEQAVVPEAFAGRVRLAAEARPQAVEARPLAAEARPLAAPSPFVLWRLNGAPARVAAGLVAAVGLWLGMAASQAVGHARVAELEPAQASELDPLDLQADALSAVPAESVAGVYLAFLSGDEGGGTAE